FSQPLLIVYRKAGHSQPLQAKIDLQCKKLVGYPTDTDIHHAICAEWSVRKCLALGLAHLPSKAAAAEFL
ncbi:hypothetical protein AVEN_105965-2-1, partial [Araneus ventricosus]